MNFFIPHIFSEFQSFEIVPPVAGISGTKDKGCNSLVLGGGYEDDTDDGDEFLFTGKFLTANLEKYHKVQTKNS